MLSEKDHDPQLFLTWNIYAAHDYIHNKKIRKEQQKENIEEKKIAKKKNLKRDREKNMYKCLICIINSMIKRYIK